MQEEECSGRASVPPRLLDYKCDMILAAVCGGGIGFVGAEGGKGINGERAYRGKTGTGCLFLSPGFCATWYCGS